MAKATENQRDASVRSREAGWRLAVVVVVLLCAVALAACGGGEGGATTNAARPAPEAGAETESQRGEATEAEGRNGSAEEGKAVFAADCASCHTLAAAGANGTIGPDLDEALPGKSPAFIEESIVDPEAEITSGYSGGIMPSGFEDSLSSAELEALVAFLGQEAGK